MATGGDRSSLSTLGTSLAENCEYDCGDGVGYIRDGGWVLLFFFFPPFLGFLFLFQSFLFFWDGDEY